VGRAPSCQFPDWPAMREACTALPQLCRGSAAGASGVGVMRTRLQARCQTWRSMSERCAELPSPDKSGTRAAASHLSVGVLQAFMQCRQHRRTRSAAECGPQCAEHLRHRQGKTNSAVQSYKVKCMRNSEGSRPT
jgi:hypothetical protein